MPSRSVQPISSQVMCVNGVNCSGTSEYAWVLSPVQLAIPRNTSDPTPAAIKPGNKIKGSVAPPSPVASMIRIAAGIGDPKITAMAAKLPAAPSTITSCGGASFFARFTANIAIPPPIAMSGASGPSTRPSARVARAASATPGAYLGSFPPAFRPSAGTCPPAPGRCTTANATTHAASTRTGSGHHQGRVSNPSRFGTSV